MYLIDIDKCFDCGRCRELVPGFFTLVENSVREIVCRKCVKPNCVDACPEEALEMVDGKLKRYTMKCVSCKQCSYACPAGANPSSILMYRTFPPRIDINKAVKICRKDAVSEIDKVPEGSVKIDKDYAAKAAGWK